MAADNNLSSFAMQNALDMQKGWDDNINGNLIVYLYRGLCNTLDFSITRNRKF